MLSTIANIEKHIKKLCIPKQHKISTLLYLNDSEMYTKMFGYVESKKMIGGNDENPYIVTYKNDNYIFNKSYDSDLILYALHKDNNKDLMPYCILVIVDKKNKCAIIESLGFDKRCYTGLQIESLEDEANGSTLLKIAMALIVKIKDHYKLKTVRLKDNARKICKGSQTGDISMSVLYMFTHGDTWYGSYGFIPYDSISGKKDKPMIKAYNNNKYIIMFTKVKETNMANHMKYAVNKLNIKMSDNEIEAFININKNMTLIKFFGELLEKYDITCGIFSIIAEKIIDELNMMNLHGISYFIKLR